MEQFIANILGNPQSAGLILVLLLSYLGGVVTSFSPCIFPMIPITFTVISSVNAEKVRIKPWIIVLIFGFGISVAYVSLGLIAVLTGSIFGSFNQSPWLRVLLANLFLVIGLNTMGWVRFPEFRAGTKQRANSVASIFLLGIFAGFTLSPCTLPVLSVILVYAASKGLVTGVLMLFMYAWGYNTLLLLIGLFGNTFRSRLPKSGNWLHIVEVLIFLLCLGIAEWLLVQSGSLF